MAAQGAHQIPLTLCHGLAARRVVQLPHARLRLLLRPKHSRKIALKERLDDL